MSKQKQTYDSAALRALRDTKLAQQADPAEQARRALTSHERVIENARRSFVDMGRALLAIRTERLYAAEYSNFGDYCDARWDISEAYANRVINAALVAIEATPIGVEINSEAVARELVGLTDKPKQLRQIWDEATRRAAGGRVTAALVKEVRQSLESPALDGELVDPLDSIPDAAKQAIEDKLAQQNQTSDTAGTSPAGGVGETAADVDTAPADGGDVPPPAAGADDHADRSAPAVTPEDHREQRPGDAALNESAAGKSAGSEGDEVGSEVDASISDSADRREQRDVAGVSRPAAPAQDLVKTPIGLMPAEFVKTLDKHAPEANPHHEWQKKFLDSVFAAAKAMRGYSGAEIAEKADDQLRAEFARFVGDMDSLLHETSVAQLAAAENIRPLRRIK